MPTNRGATSENKAGKTASRRPPIIVVMGHVDHGKTKLLDTIRKTNVIEGESGGITQHIGAYQVELDDKIITFLDTPGHEAFTAIRSRGAKVADIAILVVAADESVKPQTQEAIRIIKESDIPYVVAINKIDKEGANIERVKQDLATNEVLVEGWGGDVPVVEISALNGTGVDELLEMVLLVADLQELDADASANGTGVVIESHLDKKRGMVATILVHDGSLKVGEYIVVGTVTGKVRAMEDFSGNTIAQALPSQPAMVIGWTQAPEIGQTFRSTTVKKVADEWEQDSVPATDSFAFFKESLWADIPKESKVLNVIFKADVLSSLEAIELSVQGIESEKVAFRVLSYGVGNVNERDVKTAVPKGALILGFHVGVEPSAKKLSEKESISIETYDIIYELIEAFRTAMADQLEPELKRNVLGQLNILALFKIEGNKQVLGGRVSKGKVVRGSFVDLVKGEKRLKIGKLLQLQHNKEDVTEVATGMEAGLRIDISAAEGSPEVGDTLELYEKEKVRQNL